MSKAVNQILEDVIVGKVEDLVKEVNRLKEENKYLKEQNNKLLEKVLDPWTK